MITWIYIPYIIDTYSDQISNGKTNYSLITTSPTGHDNNTNPQKPTPLLIICKICRKACTSGVYHHQ
uniref:Uncharacterized protein n=1 Tax=Helianthus annuus TaxID=4232 RepID=A0A251SB70_HELAN